MLYSRNIHKNGMLTLIFALLTTAPIYAVAVKYQMTYKGLSIKGVDSNCPMIYDNDWWSDTPDKNYLWAKAALEQANLRANIVTRDMWD